MNDDLISRKALWESLQDVLPYQFCSLFIAAKIKEIIERAPAVDPHKHGRWREVGITMEYHHYTCSACKHNVKSPGRFCPNCGAKMDGGEER